MFNKKSGRIQWTAEQQRAWRDFSLYHIYFISILVSYQSLKFWYCDNLISNNWLLGIEPMH